MCGGQIASVVFNNENSLYALRTELNPNVMYELGLADAIGKKVMMTWDRSRGSEPPFDVNDREILFYETTTRKAIDK